MEPSNDSVVAQPVEESPRQAHAWQGASKGNSLGYRIFIRLLKSGGLGAAYALLGPVTLWYLLFRKSATRPLRYLYEKRLGYSPQKTGQTIRQNLRIFGQTLIDKVAVLSGSAEQLTFESEAGHHLNDLVARGEGGFIISAHLGNWEIAGHLLKRLEAPINVVMYDGEAAQLKSTLEQYNSKRSFNIIYIREDLSHIYEISAALRRGEFICMHADRFRPGNRTMVQLFLGEPAHFPAGPFLLASKLRAPVCFVYAFKESEFHYRFMAREPRLYEGRGSSGAEKMLVDYVALLEEKLREHPEQWFNYYDFWAARP